MMESNRRGFLGIAGTAPLVLLGLAASARGADAADCFNLDALPASQKNMRRSLGFVAISTDPNKSCGGCAFFAGPTNGCGKCQLLSGGAVASASSCRSWAKKG